MKAIHSVLLSAAMCLLPLSGVAAEKLEIGIAAMISPKDTFKYYKDMLDYVGAKVGVAVELVQRATYDEMDALLKEEKIKVAFVCSGPYVKDKSEFGAELLVAPVANGVPFYHAYIIVHKDSALKSMADLKGKKFAFTDPKSNTGKIVPTYMIAKEFNATPEIFFSNVTYTKSHDGSIYAVAMKIVDGASVDSLIYDFTAKVAPTFTQQTKIIEKSPAYGIPPIVVTKGLNPEIKKKLKAAFLEMHNDPNGMAILGKLNIDKFIVPDDKNYNSVREMERWLTHMK
jgi:phosphonate transport system substrate-binding protein